jgi:hypothetical protein
VIYTIPESGGVTYPERTSYVSTIHCGVSSDFPGAFFEGSDLPGIWCVQIPCGGTDLGNTICAYYYPGYTSPVVPAHDGTSWNNGVITPDEYPIGEVYTDTFNSAITSFNYSAYNTAQISQVNFAESDARWQTFSSLDLSLLTSVENLSNNVFPFGVM